MNLRKPRVIVGVRVAARHRLQTVSLNHNWEVILPGNAKYLEIYLDSKLFWNI